MSIARTIALVTLACLSAVPGWTQERLRPGFCAQVIPRGVDSSGTLSVKGREFSVTKFEDLRLDIVFFSNVAGDHLLEVELRSPNGHAYQTLSIPITTDTSQRGTERDVPRYPMPVEVEVLHQVATPVGRRLVATVTVPLAGTSIQTSSLYGPWQVLLSLDGERPNCLIINRFSLVE
jgi:hypothetical protein